MGPNHVTMGFIASSDNHTARPGTGYKPYERRKMTEARGPRSETWRQRVFGDRGEPVARSKEMTLDDLPARPRVDIERQASFFMTGGLVAVHAARDRDSIWNALHERHVYGTSGDRILLWFSMIDGEGNRHPMGSDITVGETPRFEVRAAGSFKQKPGCPETTTSTFDAEKLAHICAGECYNPSDERLDIARIEIVRIRPQQTRDERVGTLIEDPWRTKDCPEDSPTCRMEFEDATFTDGGRDVVYYARAIQEPTKSINAGALRCKRDAEGNCVEAHPCHSDYRTDFDDNCLAKDRERAWSSPIFARYAD